jgi:prepilin-type N-terminal cleavage/methylation domain-containing protein
MNKKNNRKGFTIVELVIVIAVIAILATVLVPTFGNVISDAKNSALLQEIKNEHTNYTVKYAKEDSYTDEVYILIGSNYYHVVNGEIEMDGTNTKAPKAFAESVIPAGATVYTPSNDTAATKATTAVNPV